MYSTSSDTESDSITMMSSQASAVCNWSSVLFSSLHASFLSPTKSQLFEDTAMLLHINYKHKACTYHMLEFFGACTVYPSVVYTFTHKSGTFLQTQIMYTFKQISFECSGPSHLLVDFEGFLPTDFAAPWVTTFKRLTLNFVCTNQDKQVIS